MGCGNSHSELPPSLDNRPESAKSEPAKAESDNESAKAALDNESEKPESDNDSAKSESDNESAKQESDNDDDADAAEEEEQEAPPGPKPHVTGSAAETAATRGRTDVQYPLVVNIVRIFTSSTFTDTKVERNSLMERVYPKLKEFCQERGYEWQVVDMRWGVRDEATDDHMTSELCMREIDECQRLSTGPNFITFLGQKYGYRPFPPKIDAVEFEAMLNATEDEADRTLLSDWLVKDNNASPPYYLLQPIREKLPDYVNDAEPDKKKEARNTWWDTFEKITLILRAAASKSLMDQAEIHRYYRAVTDEEIYRGILAAHNVPDTCYWFKRKLVDIEEHLGDKTARRFIDMVGKGLDTEANNLLSKLRDKDIPAVLPDNCITNYKVKWSENGIDPAASQEHVEYINQFCADFESTLQRMILNGIAKHKKEMVTSPTYVEYITHATFCQKRADVFHGRKDVIKNIKNLLEESDGKPLVITGGPGSGKTSLVAKVTTLLRRWRGDDVTVVVRFLGTSSQSSNTRDLLWSLCKQLADIKGDTQDIPDSYVELAEHFKDLLKSFSDPLCLVLDSLDQLSDQGKSLKEWIPQDVRSNVWVLLSTITGEDFTIEESLKAFLPSSRFLPVPPLTPDDNRVILQEWFTAECRTLTSHQMGLLEEACNQCRLPLYTKIAFDQAVRWKSSTPPDACTLGRTVEGVITGLFDLVEKYHGKIITSQTLGYITAARYGISAPELEDTVSIDDIALNDVFQYHQPPLRRLAPLIAARIQFEVREFLITSGSDGVQVIRWYHRQFQASAEKRYLSTEQQRTIIRTNLVEFFTGKWSNGVKKEYTDKKGKTSSADRYVAKQPMMFSEGDGGAIFNLRKMSELPYHLVQLGDLQGLKDHVFMNFDWLYNKIRGVGVEAVLDDYFLAAQAGMTDAEIDAVGKTLRMSKRSLRREPRQLGTELWARLGTADSNKQPNIGRLLEEAANINFNCLFTTQAFMADGDSAVDRFAGHEEMVAAFVLTKDLKTLVTCGGDQTFRLWDVGSGMETRRVVFPEDVRLNPHYSKPYDIYLCHNERAVLFSTGGQVVLYDLYKETVIHQMELEEGDDYHGDALLYVEGDKLYAVTDGDIHTHTISTWDKGPVYKVSPYIDTDDLNDTQPKDFLDGCHGKLVFHRSCQPKAQLIDLSSGKVQDIALTSSAKQAKKVVVRLALTHGGHLVSYQLTKGKDIGAGMCVYDGVMVVFDVRTGQQVKSVGSIDHGMVLGFEQLFGLTEREVLFTTCIYGQQALMAFNTETGVITKVMDTGTNYMGKAVGIGDGRFLLTYVQDNTILDCMSYHTLVGAQQQAAAASKPQVGGQVFNVRSPLPDSARYQLYDTSSSRVCVWDLATRQCVREGFPHAAVENTEWPLSQQSLSLGHEDNKLKLYSLDWGQGTTLLKATVKVFKPVDHNTRVGFLDEQRAVIQGPEPSDISMVDLTQDKVTLTLSRPKGVKQEMSGLLVSDNRKVAVLFRAEDNDKKEKRSKDGTLDTAIYAFDLQAEKYLGETSMKAKEVVTAANVKLQRAVLTPDGRSLISLVDTTEATVIGVADVFNLKWRIIPNPDGMGWPTHVGYSPTLKAIVVIYVTGHIVTYNAETLTQLGSMVDEGYCRNVAFSHDGLLVAFNKNDRLAELTVVDLRLMDVVAKFTGHAEVSGLGWSGDNCCLLVGMKGVRDPVQLYLHRPSGGGKGKYSSEREYLKQLQGQKDIFGKPTEVTFVR